MNNEDKDVFCSFIGIKMPDHQTVKFLHGGVGECFMHECTRRQQGKIELNLS